MRIFAIPTRTHFRALPVLAALLALPLAANAQETYIALGDSYAFGYTNSAAPPSNGNQGYASILRGILDSRNGADTVELINLAIPGETSTSFFSGPSVLVPNADPNLVVTDALLRNRPFNTNYNGDPATVFQADKFQTTISALTGFGRQADYVTVQMGGNDILSLFVQPGFNSLSTGDQFGLLYNRLETLSFNLATALTGINAAAPNADIALIGYADPFPGLGPFNPFPTLNFNPFGPLARVTVNTPLSLTTILTLEANVRIAEAAANGGARYVDIYTPFLGNELALSQIQTIDQGFPNFHPSPAGYGVIANAIAAPEPGSAALLLLGALPIVGVVARRRK